ncbi:hypothetical protein IFT84_21185 [Rhizobium sp. CFBP 8762]|uniref:hypothetical protein n=1 Tax=Rhizobium sp. CFBP 8762 TaxID=2775279 RepID=UPI001784E7E0|nr:hypothetical protein [Rhizobium sp. CFBP 8762]MBD8557008.1 hypothetical protein [Rhizobium sp. CFBP 8762]
MNIDDLIFSDALIHPINVFFPFITVCPWIVVTEIFALVSVRKIQRKNSILTYKKNKSVRIKRVKSIFNLFLTRNNNNNTDDIINKIK